MKTTKTNSVLRFACALLAVLTVVVSLPLFAIESEAVVGKKHIEHRFDFSGGTPGKTIETGGDTGGYVKLSSTAFTYATDPKDNSKIVAKGSKGQFTFDKDVSLLAGKKFFIEMRLNIDSIGSTSSNQLSLIALTMSNTSATDTGGTAIPLVRLLPTNKEDPTKRKLEMRKPDGVYEETSAEMKLGEWHTVKVVVDDVTHRVDLYLDGTKIHSLAMVGTYKFIPRVRIMHNSKTWTGYIDYISYGVEVDSVDTEKYNEYISFEEFAEDDKLTGEAILDTNTVSANRLAKLEFKNDIYVKADPDNAGNMVSYNKKSEENGKKYSVNLYENEKRLASTSFAISMDVRFSSFPVHTENKPVALASWMFNGVSGIFSRVDSNGSLLNKSNGFTGYAFKLEKWSNFTVLCDGTTGEYDVYLDGEYVFSDDIGDPTTTDTDSYIRLFNNTGSVEYEVCVDNIMLYETERTAPAKEADVIWDVNFDDITTGNFNTKKKWSDLSDIADADYVLNSTSNAYTVAKLGDGKAFKVTNGTNNDFIDLYMGNGEFDPLRTDGLSFKFDFTVENLDSIASTDEKPRLHHLVSWRRFDDIKGASAMRVLSFNDKGFTFLGNQLDIVIEAEETYSIEIIFNSERNTATLKINGEVIVDSYSVSTGDNQLDGVNKSYFFDDAGNKYPLPYTGLVKSLLYDNEGKVVTDADKNFVFVNKLVSRKNFYADMFRLFQGTAGSTAVYYIDNIKAERIEPEVIFSTDFTGWEKLTPSKENTDYRFHNQHATFVNSDGNTYVSLSENSNQRIFYGFGDRDMKYYGNDLYFETDVKLVNTNDTDTTSLISFVEQTSAIDPFDGTGRTITLLSRDGQGNLYISNSSKKELGQLKVLKDENGETKDLGWTKIGIYLHGNGKKWTYYDVYVDGVYKATNTFVGNIADDIVTYSFRYRAINNEMWFDNISVYYPNDIKADFETEAEVESVIARLDGGWMYGTLNATRTSAVSGGKVTTAQLLGDDGSKYLRVNHNDLTGNKSAYIDVTNEMFIDADDYLIETSLRFTSDTDSTLNIAEIYRPMAKQSAPILAVRGGTNQMYAIKESGVPYDLVYSDGQPIVAAQTDNSTFTDVAILVDGVENTYTLYINGRLAYYVYNGKKIPCAKISLGFRDNEVAGVKDFIRLLEISNYKYQEGILDIDYLKVISLGNGIGSSVKGTQTQVVTPQNAADTTSPYYGVRFVSGIDTLYGAKIGYEITAVYTDDIGTQTKSDDRSSSLVFEKVSSDAGDITAVSLDSAYLAAIEVSEIPMETEVEFTVKPYVSHGGVKIYGEAYTASFKADENDKIVVE